MSIQLTTFIQHILTKYLPLKKVIDIEKKIYSPGEPLGPWAKLLILYKYWLHERVTGEIVTPRKPMATEVKPRLTLTQIAWLSWVNVGKPLYRWLMVGVGCTTLGQRHSVSDENWKSVPFILLALQRWANIDNCADHKVGWTTSGQRLTLVVLTPKFANKKGF